MKLLWAILLATPILSTSAVAVAQDGGRVEFDEPHSVLAFSIRTESVHAAVHGVTELRAGRVAAIEACEAEAGSQCIMAMAYPTCGAMAELQLGRALGNPVGWAPSSARESIDLRTAMDSALAQCDSQSRDIARRRFQDDEVLMQRVETARCSIVYYHCTDWEN
jgi:hypothetical protein